MAKAEKLEELAEKLSARSPARWLDKQDRLLALGLGVGRPLTIHTPDPYKRAALRLCLTVVDWNSVWPIAFYI